MYETANMVDIEKFEKFHINEYLLLILLKS